MRTVDDEHETIGLAEWERNKPGKAWAWWLANGASDGPGLRRWQLWIWWTRQRDFKKRIRAAVGLVRGFIEAPIEAWGGLQHGGKKTALLHRVSYFTQFRQLLILRWRFGVRPESYYKFQLFRSDRYSNAQHFVEESGQLLQVVLRHSPRAEDEKLFLSKEEFRLWCREHNLPTVQNLIEVREGVVVSRFVPSLPEVDLFVKPTNWRQGKGASRWTCISTEQGYKFADNGGYVFSAIEFEDYVCRVSVEQGRPYIVQPALKNHPALLGFTNGALATVRLMTTRAGHEQSRPLMAAFRMPNGDAVADNFDLGGVAAPIDLTTGQCGTGICKKGQYPPDPVTSHPDTGEQISGLIIPWWSECVTLACRAHDLIETHVPVIGWDIAVLEDGPVIVEPNHLPCGNLAQMPSGFALGKSEFAIVVSERLRAIFL